MKDLPKAYEPKQYEDDIYKKWEDSGLFNPDVCVAQGVTKDDADTFSIVLPPPNVTGTLHMGHAAMLAIEDVMIRYRRMKGDKTLWLPGTDHAAVATESKVEQLLIDKGMKKPKQELGREPFLQEVRDFAKASHDTIVNQARKMGSSLDWSREAFTMDPVPNKVVRSVFKKMYDDGLIYRGYRVVNWSVKGQSTCSDDELVHVERPGKLYYFKYSHDFPIPIATTRPETKLGDTAVAVHPEGRWKQYIGQTFTIPNFGQAGHTLTLNIFGDDGVDDSFGTGALGVTTAHSQTDFDMYQKQKALGNDIGLIQVIGEDGNMTANAGADYMGLSVVDARQKVVAWLDAQGLLEKSEDIVQNVGTSDRFKDVVEPLPKTQWFIDVNKKFVLPYSELTGIENGQEVTLKELMQTVVQSKQITIVPDRFEKTYFYWINNLRDWCISRQIWYGHQIPVWYKGATQPTEITYFVHATTTDNEAGNMSGHSDPKLSQLGGKQAMELKELLKDQDFDIVITSDLERATDTARIVFGDKDVDIIYDPRLRECNYGDLNGQHESKKLESDAYYIGHAYPNGESYTHVTARVAECLADMQTRFAGKKIAVLGHRWTQNAIEVLLNQKSWTQAIAEDWRHTKQWQPGWKYSLNRITYAATEAPKGDGWIQDSDTLDTWFSAGLWTFSTLLDRG
ncbi:MAG: class I tRNA ligase family protein, partial [Candidatus Magasanikbacteria bacterium]|nr:class I tRNA ligase family protein [Candidatus Magasanikbacteria bacterium]